jgi:dipeptidyl aminopeptidase/acylaminoacyl peptidase
MKKRPLLLFTFIVTTVAFAQEKIKPSLNLDAVANWPVLNNGKISKNSEYILYTVPNKLSNSSVVVTSLKTSWKRELINASNPIFTSDNRIVISRKGDDSLCLLELGKDHIEYIPGVSSYRIYNNGNEQILLYKKNTTLKQLVLRNLRTHEEKNFPGILEYEITRGGNTLVLKTEWNENKAMPNLILVNLNTYKCDSISIPHARNFIVDNTGRQLAFVVEGENGMKSIWYYNEASKRIKLLLNDSITDKKCNLQIDDIVRFSKSCHHIFIKLSERKLERSGIQQTKVDIWTYKDSALQTQQAIELQRSSGVTYNATINVVNQNLVLFDNDNENPVSFNDRPDSLTYLYPVCGDLSELKWNKFVSASTYIVSNFTGERIRIPFTINDSYNGMSPDGRYVIGIDSLYRDYKYYDNKTRQISDLTIPIPEIQNNLLYEYGADTSKRVSLVGWISDSTILLSDKYDIWRVDLGERIKTINLTNGYGRKHALSFSLIFSQPKNDLKGEHLVIKAFNIITKDAGFYQLDINKAKDPEVLNMGPYAYEIDRDAIGEFNGTTYLIKRMSAMESPNYFTTKDFKTFRQVTFFYPERAYNWLTAELITWNYNGQKRQGVIYRPENIDKHKKYPVLLNFYLKRTDELNYYKTPELAQDNIDIPWFVSNGYIVFEPDIYYKEGDPGDGAYQSVMSGIEKIKSIPEVDEARIGIQGHSWGGYEVNYIVTHTNFFAAACTASSISDFISMYNAIWPSTGMSNNVFFERGVANIGHTLWDRPELFIKNSPVFDADKVTTPVLMMQNKADAAGGFAQGLEFFLALRREHKKVWLLQYDEGAHSLYTESDKRDYTIRLTQFFDFYLKDAAAPDWMVKGVPLRLKGIENGLNFNYTNIEP